MVVERLVELIVARRNQRWLISQGAVEVGVEHYPWMVVQHALFLVSCALEVWWLQRPFYPTLALAMVALVVAAMALRYWTMTTLGRRWTTRVFCLPGEPVITSGPYRFLRHPNYLAVAVEIFALPMIHTAWLTATVFSLANAWLLSRRIRAEEAGLRRHNDFDARFGADPGRG
jgi:methyltransferase